MPGQSYFLGSSATQTRLRPAKNGDNFPLMTDAILYRRKMPHGPEVRIRRTSDSGEVPVMAVLDVDRRAGTPREKLGGTPPALKEVQGATEQECVALLKPEADDDRAVSGLLRAKGLR